MGSVDFPTGGSARCGAPGCLPPCSRRSGSACPWVAGIAWAVVLLLVVARGDAIHASLHAMRWGIEPLAGVLLAQAGVALVLCVVAAAALCARARSVRAAPHGTVVEIGDGGVVVELVGEDPQSIALDGGARPERAAIVTLIGVRRRSPDGGPFRDGAPQLRARFAWVGRPQDLSRTLTYRAAGLLSWSAVCAAGVLVQLL